MLKDKASIAIAALDETELGVDPQEHARMPECGIDFPGTIAGDLQAGNANDLGWLDRWHDWQVATRRRAFNEGQSSVVIECDVERTGVGAFGLACVDVEGRANRESEELMRDDVARGVTVNRPAIDHHRLGASEAG